MKINACMQNHLSKEQMLSFCHLPSGNSGIFLCSLRICSDVALRPPLDEFEVHEVHSSTLRNAWAMNPISFQISKSLDAYPICPTNPNIFPNFRIPNLK